MKTKIKARISIYNGRITGMIMDEIKNIENRIVKIQWDDGEKLRTIDQNALYWLFIHFCLQYYRNYDPTLSADDLHFIFKSGYKMIPKVIGNKTILVPESTTEKNVLSFMDYVQFCYGKATEDGVPVEIFLAEYEEHIRRLNE